MHISCEHCQAAITIDDLAAFQRDGVTCPICNTFHYVTTGRRTSFEEASAPANATIVRRQRKP